LDYQISYDQATGTSNYVVLVSGLRTQAYTTTVTLTPGATYIFLVQARNSVGLSPVSSTLSVVARQPPS
jgi:hypothetical protein